MGGIRNQRTVLGLLVAVVASAGLVWALGGGDSDERSVGSVAPLARPVATTTPPEVLGDVVVRTPGGEQAEVEQAAAEQLAAASPAPQPAASPTSSPPPPTAPPAPTTPTTSAPAPTPSTAAPVTTTPTTTEPAALAAAIELQREPAGRPLQVDLLRDGVWVAGGTLDAVLRFEDLPAGPYELWVSWDTGVLVDEEDGTAISGSGITRSFVDARAGETTVIRCGEQECDVP